MDTIFIKLFTSTTQSSDITAFSYLFISEWDFNKALLDWLGKDDKQDNKESDDDMKSAILMSKINSGFYGNFSWDNNGELNYIDITGYTFVSFDFGMYGFVFEKFLFSELICESTLKALEKAGRLNWWKPHMINNHVCPLLYPLLTLGDGNCLLHAASMAIWGFHDRLIMLRMALFDLFRNHSQICKLYRRWRWQMTQQNQQDGFSITKESEWNAEWNSLMEMLAPTLDTNSSYTGLEQIHILGLANILRRPIIILADIIHYSIRNEPMAPVRFSGIYLPYLCRPEYCHKSPIVLAYNSGHFSPLFPMEISDTDDYLVPITDSDGDLLPIQFCVDPGAEIDWRKPLDSSLSLAENDQMDLLRQYMDLSDNNQNGYRMIDLTNEDAIDTNSNNNNNDIVTVNKVTKQFQYMMKLYASITDREKNDNVGKSKCRRFCRVSVRIHSVQQNIIHNVSEFLKQRFLNDPYNSLSVRYSKKDINRQVQVLKEGLKLCITDTCSNFGNSFTNNLCKKCYKSGNKVLESKKNNQGGAGNSIFYRETNWEDYDALRQLPVHKAETNNTLYLGKSTFYYDKKLPNNHYTISEEPEIDEGDNKIEKCSDGKELEGVKFKTGCYQLCDAPNCYNIVDTVTPSYCDECSDDFER